MRPSPGLSLERNMSWTLVGRLVYGACQAGVLVAIAKLGTVQLVGQFAVAFAVTAPVMVFANLQLRTLYASDVRDETPFSAYVRLRWWASGLGLVAIVAIASSGGFSREAALAITVVGAAKAVETFLDLGYGVYQRHGRMDAYGQSLALRGLGGLVGVAVTLHVGGSLCAALVAMGLAWTTVLIAVDRPRTRALRRERAGDVPAAFGGSALRLARLTLPLGVVMLLDSLTQNAHRIVVEGLLGEEQLGLLASMLYVVTAAGVFVFAVSAPLVPRLAERFAAGQRRAFARLAGALVSAAALFGALGVAGAAAFGEAFLRIAYAPEYAEHAHVFVWVMLGGALHFVLSAQATVLTGARILKLQPIAYLLALLLTLVLCFLWIPGAGLLGAAQAAVAGWAAATAFLGAATVLACVRPGILTSLAHREGD